MGADLIIVTIWLCILAYVAGALVFAFAAGAARDRAARLLWTSACIALLTHVALAFHLFHGWSHTAAYADTARQTREMFGWNWGGGLYFNYALMSGWVADVVWWWAAGVDSYRHRDRWIVVIWHAFLFFMIVNATVVFGSSVSRVVGLMVCTALGVAWWKALTAKGAFLN